MPLGLLALGSWLADEHVVIVDGRFELAPEARVLELARDALCLGVTVRTGRPLRDALRVSAVVRAAQPDLPILWGGAHATHRPASCLATGVVDACVRGAGEEAFAGCVKAIRAPAAYRGVPGLAWEGQQELPAAAPPPAPERTPRAQYALLDVERHFEARAARRLDYCSSRGVREAMGGTWLGLPADRVVAELGELDDRYGLGEVLFQDEDFFADRSRAEAIARGLLDAEGSAGWQVAAYASDVLEAGDDALRLFAGSGCRKVHVRIPPGVVPQGPLKDAILEAGARLHAAGLGGRFVFAVDEVEVRGGGLGAVQSVARTLSAMDCAFETPIRRHRTYPPEADVAAGGHPSELEAWAHYEDAAWTDRRAEQKLARSTFYFAEAQRPPGRRWGKRLVRVLALTRVRLGMFGLDVERLVVEASALLRTGRNRVVGREE